MALPAALLKLMPLIGLPAPLIRLLELVGAKSAATCMAISGRPAWIRPLISRYRASMLIDPRDKMVPFVLLVAWSIAADT